MKYLLILSFLTISVTATAQHDDLYYFKKRLEKEKREKALAQYHPPVLLPRQNSNPTLLEKQDYVMSDGNKVTLLAQDNMPCVRPDMNQFNMPNAGSIDMLRKDISAIPNPSDNLRIFKSFTSVEAKEHP